MGILDSVTGMLGGHPDAALASQVISMLTSSEAGGLNGLVEQFKSAGLAQIVGSWIGTGANLPISTQQLTHALGNAKISELASRAGVPAEQAAGTLAELLPTLVDKLTPGGTIPSGAGLLSQAASMLGALGAKG